MEALFSPHLISPPEGGEEMVFLDGHKLKDLIYSFFELAAGAIDIIELIQAE